MSNFQAIIPNKNKQPNYFYSIISVALVLFLLGLCGLMLLNTQHFVIALKEQVKVFVEIKPEASNAQKEGLIDRIGSSRAVKEHSLRFVSKEDAFGILQKDLGTEISNFDFQNPLYDQLSFNLNATFMQPDSLIKIRKYIKMNAAVMDVYYEEGLVDNIDKNLKKIGYFALAIGVIFLIVAIILIHNTMKLALFSNRFLIKNMELVGASWGFISRPFLLKGIRNGFFSGLIAIILLTIILLMLRSNLPELFRPEYMPSFAVLFGLLLVIGIFISAGSTYYVVNRYLNMRMDDLY